MTSLDAADALAALTQIQDTLDDVAQQMTDAAQNEIDQARPNILQEMRLASSQSPLPFEWSSDPVAQARARGWYFANVVPKGSRGGRYPRTGALEQATEVNAILGQTGGEATLDNDAPGAVFVFGFRQVPSHARSGHPLAVNVADKWSPILAERIGDDWLGIADPFASGAAHP